MYGSGLKVITHNDATPLKIGSKLKVGPLLLQLPTSNSMNESGRTFWGCATMSQWTRPLLSNACLEHDKFMCD